MIYHQECTAAGDGGASPTTKVYKFWFFYHQNVQILVFLPQKCTNFSFFYRTVRILGHHMTSRTPLAVHPWTRFCHRRMGWQMFLLSRFASALKSPFILTNIVRFNHWKKSGVTWRLKGICSVISDKRPFWKHPVCLGEWLWWGQLPMVPSPLPAPMNNFRGLFSFIFTPQPSSPPQGSFRHYLFPDFSKIHLSQAPLQARLISAYVPRYQASTIYILVLSLYGQVPLHYRTLSIIGKVRNQNSLSVSFSSVPICVF